MTICEGDDRPAKVTVIICDDRSAETVTICDGDHPKETVTICEGDVTICEGDSDDLKQTVKQPKSTQPVGGLGEDDGGRKELCYRR